MLERNWIKTFGITLGAAGILAAFIAGKTAPLQEISAYTYAVTTRYNWPLALGGILGALFAAAFFLALASIYEQQALAVKALGDIRESLAGANLSAAPATGPLPGDEKEQAAPQIGAEPQPETPAAAAPQAQPSDAAADAGTIVCPRCGLEQPDTRNTCHRCWATLKKWDGAVPPSGK